MAEEQIFNFIILQMNNELKLLFNGYFIYFLFRVFSAAAYYDCFFKQNNMEILEDCVIMFDDYNALNYLIPIIPNPPIRISPSSSFNTAAGAASTQQAHSIKSSALSLICSDVLLRLSYKNPSALRELLCRWRCQLSSLQLEPLIDSVKFNHLILF